MDEAGRRESVFRGEETMTKSVGSDKVLSVVSGVRWRCEAGEKGKADRQRIPDTTTWTKPLEKAYGDWFPSCFVGRRWSGLLEDGAWRRAKAAAEMEGIKERVGRQIPTLV